MATWPSYARILRDGYAENPESALLRTDMESGPAKQVMIKSKVLVQRPITVLISSASDYSSWLTWFQTTIHRGADWFDWTDPRTASIKSARIVGGSYTAEHAAALAAWKLAMTLETWE